eukprot:CAMPEP_0185740798 /NCGR_PEP_ID=MMETSP1171-20130828/38612_1 /TAXON_ID=374046 /ORGANISM="Helicotheca tamensis, Strain CCMP826" /LENGTH=165 /DNA_ID=CAMNT_0028412723 /DNA_START=131 /DNA_END=628 /DNA_ORIENTATION=+
MPSILQSTFILGIFLSINVWSFTIHPLSKVYRNYNKAKCKSPTLHQAIQPPFLSVMQRNFFMLATSSSDNTDITSSDKSPNDQKEEKSSIEEEMERLQQTLASIEALEERNKAQLDSFIDEEDQWESMEEFERDLLNSKEEIVERMEKISEELLQMWMGAKSMEG